MEFNKEKFSHYIMKRPYFGEFTENPETGHLVKHALDKAGCGDAYEISLHLSQSGKIEDARYITFGCGYAQATCCALIESIVGHDLSEVAHWSENEVGEKIESLLGDYPVHKKAYLYFAKELLAGACQKAPQDLVLL